MTEKKENNKGIVVTFYILVINYFLFGLVQGPFVGRAMWWGIFCGTENLTSAVEL